MRVVLTGTYCSKNKGDAAMQQVFATELLRRRPGATVIIAAPFPKIDSDYYHAVEMVTSSRRNLPIATLHWLILELLRALHHSPSHYPLNAETNAIAQADAVVDLSGDMLTEDYGPLVGYSHFLPLLQAQSLGRPVIVCAQSIGPFSRLKRLARHILARASLITVRESVTTALLASLKHPEIAPVRTADLAFLLQPAPSDVIDTLLAAERIPAAVRPRLGVSVSALLANRTNRHLGTTATDTLSAFAQALDDTMERMGVEVLLVPHVFGPKPSGDDRQVCAKLATMMRHPPLRLLGEYRPEELKGVIARCDAFVGCRMHANIAALDSGIPVLAIGYSHKTRGILSDLGLSEWILPIDNIEAHVLTAAIERLFAEAPAYRHQLKAELHAVRARASENIDLALEIIETSMRERVHE